MHSTSAWIVAAIASSSFWESVEYWSIGAVVVGVIGEYTADFTRLKHSDMWRHRVEKWSTLLVIAALAIELLATVRTNAINNLTIADLGNKAQQAAKQAGDLGAKVDELPAFVARQKSDYAMALSALDELRHKFDKVNADTVATAESAKRNVADMQKALAPRSLSPEQRLAFLEHLEKYHGVSVDVYVTNSAPDAAALASSLASLLSAAHWKSSGVSTLLAGPPIKGVVVATRSQPATTDQQAALGLIKELISDGIATSPGIGVTDNPVAALGALVGSGGDTPANLWVVVGSKP